MTKKIMMILITMLFIISIMKCKVYSARLVEGNILSGEGSSTETKDATNFTPEEWEPSSTTSVSNAGKLEKIGNKIIGTIKVIGSIISVATLIILGIKYILGSVEEKAEYKKTMKPYILGAIMVFAITNLLSIVQNIVGGF